MRIIGVMNNILNTVKGLILSFAVRGGALSAVSSKPQ
jgi:hypothetical protein